MNLLIVFNLYRGIVKLFGNIIRVGLAVQLPGHVGVLYLTRIMDTVTLLLTVRCVLIKQVLPSPHIGMKHAYYSRVYCLLVSWIQILLTINSIDFFPVNCNIILSV